MVSSPCVMSDANRLTQRAALAIVLAAFPLKGSSLTAAAVNPGLFVPGSADNVWQRCGETFTGTVKVFSLTPSGSKQQPQVSSEPVARWREVTLDYFSAEAASALLAIIVIDLVLAG